MAQAASNRQRASNLVSLCQPQLQKLRRRWIDWRLSLGWFKTLKSIPDHWTLLIQVLTLWFTWDALRRSLAPAWRASGCGGTCSAMESGRIFTNVCLPRNPACPRALCLLPFRVDWVWFDQRMDNAFTPTCDETSSAKARLFQSAGLDNLHPGVLKELAEGLSVPLRLVFSNSWNAEDASEDWAKVEATMPACKQCKWNKRGKYNSGSVTFNLVQTNGLIQSTQHGRIFMLKISCLKEWSINLSLCIFKSCDSV